MERTKEKLEQLAKDVIALNTPDKQPAASDSSVSAGSDAEMLKAAGYVLQEAVERLMAVVDERDRYKAALEEIAGNESGINAECADGIAITALAFENVED
jgi:hypothetical protein